VKAILAAVAIGAAVFNLQTGLGDRVVERGTLRLPTGLFRVFRVFRAFRG
jgi:hypothetical protein